MTRAWYHADSTGRIGATTTIEKYANGMTQYDFPDDFDFGAQADYRVVDGELVYDPLPEPEPQPSVDERLDAVESGMAALTSAFDTEEVATDGN